jgi:uncharacterized coiled-coil DUF342 family protein
MKKEEFIKEIEDNCSEILHISVKHMLDKLYEQNVTLDEDANKEFFSNYRNFHLYLNDFAGTIYSKYASSVDNLYIEMCNYLKIDIDNKYTLEHTIMKLEKQSPSVIMSLENEDIQMQTIDNFEDKLVAIAHSTHYNENLDEFKSRVDKLKANISLVKNALQLS